MPSLLTHAAVPIAIALAAGRGQVSPRLCVAGVVACMLPDADVAAFAFGIPYADAFGHRGASHSLSFAFLLAGAAAVCARRLHARSATAGAFVLACAASHPLLDTMTSGGLGVALLWPWSDARLFAPWRPILVSPFANGFFSARGLATLWSELKWVWLPLLVCAGAWRTLRGSHHGGDPR